MDPAIQPHQPTHEQHAGRAAHLKEPSKQALEASRAAEAPASTSSKSYQRAHALTQAVPSGAAHLDCVERAGARQRAACKSTIFDSFWSASLILPNLPYR